MKRTTDPYRQAKLTAAILGIIIVIGVLMALTWVALDARPTPVHADGLPCLPTPVVVKTTSGWLRYDVHRTLFGANNCQLYAQRSDDPAQWGSLWIPVSQTSGDVMAFAVDAATAPTLDAQVVVWSEFGSAMSLRIAYETCPGCAWTSQPLHSSSTATIGLRLDLSRKPYYIEWVTQDCWNDDAGPICVMRYETCDWRAGRWGIPFFWWGLHAEQCYRFFLPLAQKRMD